MIKSFAMLFALAAMPTTAAAQSDPAPSYLPTAEAVRRVMDGQPWNGLAPNGRKARITLNKDGSGNFDGGPFSMAISWAIKQDDICLNLGMAGTKCVRFAPIAKGYQAYVAGKPDLAFTR